MAPNRETFGHMENQFLCYLIITASPDKKENGFFSLKIEFLIKRAKHRIRKAIHVTNFTLETLEFAFQE